MSKPLTELTVVATERLTPSMVRLRFRADDLSAFAGSAHTDRYVKLVFGDPAELAAGGRPVMRTYTALEPDVEAGTLSIDFVVHGDEGVAGPWAAAAQPGDTITVRGPGGAYAPDPDADWHLLAGDEAALPAIRQALTALPAEAVGHVVIEVADADHEQPLHAPAGIGVTWLHRSAGGGRAALVDAVRSLEWLPGRVHAFVHGEAQAVMHGIRPYLLTERGVPRADASVSGYWRVGRTEESFRQWKADLAAAESANEPTDTSAEEASR
ncbi:siderophore-interacting protein [Nocardioides sp. GY 10113]|uniref:siderophore-interacting protein n=1 Tax=Nocardioides sp. GY 10113 TaxID=2569761 RepID=UPI0010A8236A|nr:siderophore-interacting protein [Nocardioides sp. GY 10113]TIC83218.1 siderophore-interacting protein [Nocardioides sp. GY 10113]